MRLFKDDIGINGDYKGDEFCHKLKLSPPHILATRCRRPLIFQTMSSVRSKSLSLKYYRFTPSGCKDIEIKTFEFVAKTRFLLFKVI